MEQKDMIKVSVLDLISCVMQSGDLCTNFTGSQRMTESIKAHQLIQQSENGECLSEISVSFALQRDDMSIEVNGRIDRIIETSDSVIIDEIKTTLKNLVEIEEDYNPLHFAQAKCYAYIYSIQNEYKEIKVQLTYYHMETKETKCFLKHFHIYELEEFFFDLIDRYLHWVKVIKNWTILRDESIKKLDFPFVNYREGQRKLAVGVYKTIRNQNKLFIQAPTGTGKTIASLFPAVKAVGEGLTNKIFYLTAKTTTRTVAENSFDIMRKSGLCFKTLILTAKEKLCFNDEALCDPEKCDYAKGYYDRVNSAVEDIFKLDSFTKTVIEDYARKYNVCPFEFSLDLSLWADCIICDYNYAFDPRVYLKRFFMENNGKYCFLIDEAHNLVDRCREMFSAQLFKNHVLDLKRSVKGYSVQLSKSLKVINSWMISARKACETEDENYRVQKEEPKELYPLLRDFVDICESYLTSKENYPFRQQLLDSYFEAAAFLRASEYYDEHFVTYYEKTGSDLRIKMFCIDPSMIMKKVLKRAKSAVFFSATLIPVNYFMEMLGGDEESLKVKLQSPFSPDNLCLLIDDKISTKYRMRQSTYDRVADSILVLASGNKGNYIVYFPSYKYMDEVYKIFIEKNAHVKSVIQRPGMSEIEREEFLSLFSLDNTEILIGFAVMGGVFSEGIDLTGDRLSGAVIVGVGLPQICPERDIIRDYFEGLKKSGFEYSYIYPGMNKVLQAAGRVIRTENDRGVVLLLDDRFSHNVYKSLFPREWRPVRVKSSEHVQRIISEFWAIKK